MLSSIIWLELLNLDIYNPTMLQQESRLRNDWNTEKKSQYYGQTLIKGEYLDFPLGRL